MNQSNCNVTSTGYQYHLFPLVYGVVLVLGLPSNLLALFVFLFKVTPRTSFSVYIINLALADIVILLTLPFRIHYHLRRNHWVFGDMACRVTGTLWYANIYISICFMTCICVDRYVAVVHPHSYLKLKNPRHAAAVSVLLWAALGVAILTFILMGPLESASGSSSCFENFAQDEWGRRMGAYSALSLIFCSLLPSAVILVCYPLAMRRISHISGRTSRRAQRIILTVLAITLLCFLPYHVVHLLHLLRRLEVIRHCALADGIYHARRVTMALVSLNPCLDPLLYYVTSKHYTWRPLRRLWLWGRVRRTVGIYTLSHPATAARR